MKEDIEKLVNKFSEMQGSAALSIETLQYLYQHLRSLEIFFNVNKYIV